MRKELLLISGLMIVATSTACNVTETTAVTSAEVTEVEVTSTQVIAAEASTPAVSTTDSNDTVQISNPFKECDTLAEAAEICGFELTVPTEIPGYTQDIIQTMNTEMIQVFFIKDQDEIVIRKAMGTYDISGDYNGYKESSVTTIESYEVTMKGDNGVVYVATWTDQDYSYAVDVTGTGLTVQEMSKLIGDVR